MGCSRSVKVSRKCSQSVAKVLTKVSPKCQSVERVSPRCRPSVATVSPKCQSVAKMSPKCRSVENCQFLRFFCNVFPPKNTRSGVSRSVNFCGLADLHVFAPHENKVRSGKKCQFPRFGMSLCALSMPTGKNCQKTAGTPHIRKRHFGNTTGDTPTNLNIRRPKIQVLGLRARYNTVSDERIHWTALRSRSRRLSRRSIQF